MFFLGFLEITRRIINEKSLYLSIPDTEANYKYKMSCLGIGYDGLFSYTWMHGGDYEIIPREKICYMVLFHS